MIPGMNPRKMGQMMKRMGIQQQEIDATQVIIKTPQKNLVINSPQVSKVNMMGQEMIQVIGDVNEESVESEPEISDDDVRTVVEQTGASEEKARETIKKNKGDLASSIMELKSE